MADSDSDFSARYKEVDALVLKIKQDWRQEDIDRLVELHLPLLKRAVKHHRYLNATEAFSIAKEVFIDLVHFFDPSKGVYFNTFIRNSFWWRLLGRVKKHQIVATLPQDIAVYDEHNLDIKEYYELIRLKRGEIMGDIFLLKVVFGFTRKELASVAGVTQKDIDLYWEQIADFLRETINL